MSDPNQLSGKKALLIGLGNRQGGLGVARYLLESGAEVRVTDLRNEVELAATLHDLRGSPIHFTLGHHNEDDFRWADVVVRNPAVPRESPWLQLARELGKRVEMEMTLFFRACPAPIIGVTGTKGKTTTTSLLSEMLRERWPDSVLAGNMGRSALMQLSSIRPGVPVAIELSSFQLEGLDEHKLSPHVGVITNISPDHLDRYPSLEEYVSTKAAIFRWQSRNDWAVYDRATLDECICSAIAARHATFGSHPPHERSTTDGDTVENALWIERNRFAGRWDSQPIDLGPVAALRLPGEHSRLNALSAAAAALAAGVSPEQITHAIAGFTCVPHRLEHVATIRGVDYINDTAATAPAAGVAGLRAFAGRDVIAISGGYDKQLPMEPYADELARSARRVVLLEGTVTPKLIEMLRDRDYAALEGPVASMADAVQRAAAVAGSGSVVLLSPGCASFGLFRDEFHRGDAFRDAVADLKREEGS